MSLDAFSTSELSDALIDLGIPHGGLIPDLQLISPQIQRLCGPAHTVQIAHISEPAQNAPPKEHFVDTVPPGHVIVISSPPRCVTSDSRSDVSKG
jgi:regulator of RNase E activity RraA